MKKLPAPANSRVKPHSRAGMKDGNQFEYRVNVALSSPFVISQTSTVNSRFRANLPIEDDEIVGYEGNHRKVGAVPNITH